LGTNLGWLDWSIWTTLLRIWPVFLIALGIDLLVGRRSALGALVAALLIVAVLAGAIYVAWQPSRGVGLTARSWCGHCKARPAPR